MIFRQLFEPVSSTYTYLLGCPETRQAVLIDPVMPAWQRDLKVMNDLGLKLVMTIDTHIHADHITSATMLKREIGSRIALPALDALPCADVPMQEGVPVEVGGIRLNPMHTMDPLRKTPMNDRCLLLGIAINPVYSQRVCRRKQLLR